MRRSILLAVVSSAGQSRAKITGQLVTNDEGHALRWANARLLEWHRQGLDTAEAHDGDWLIHPAHRDHDGQPRFGSLDEMAIFANDGEEQFLIAWAEAWAPEVLLVGADGEPPAVS